jgi:hypothetical protein
MITDMAEAAASRGATPRLAESIAEKGKAAFDPRLDAASREQGLVEYEKLIEKYEHVSIRS